MMIRVKANVELIALESVMVQDRPMTQATFQSMHVNGDRGLCKFSLNFTEEEAEKLSLHSKFELELNDAN